MIVSSSDGGGGGEEGSVSGGGEGRFGRGGASQDTVWRREARSDVGRNGTVRHGDDSLRSFRDVFDCEVYNSFVLDAPILI